jgi:hypothetical protein
MTTQKPDQLGEKHGSNDNPFTAMGFISFWLLSAVFYLTFPLSLGLCLLVMGRHRTKQLIRALAQDFADNFYLTGVCGADNLGSMAFSVTLIWRVNRCDLVQGVIWLRARFNG